MSLWRCTVTADPRVQPAEVCAQRSAAWYLHIIHCHFSYSLHCQVKWRGLVACLFHTHSASPRLPVLHALLYESHETSAPARCNRWRMKPWSSTTEMSWLSRAINSVTFSVLFLAISLSRGYFLLKVSASVCCFGKLEFTCCLILSVCFLFAVSNE